jgi:hypothetical protein
MKVNSFRSYSANLVRVKHGLVLLLASSKHTTPDHDFLPIATFSTGSFLSFHSQTKRSQAIAARYSSSRISNNHLAVCHLLATLDTRQARTGYTC